MIRANGAGDGGTIERTGCLLGGGCVVTFDDKGEKEHALWSWVFDDAVFEQLDELGFLAHTCFEGYDVGVFDGSDSAFTNDTIAFALSEVAEVLVELSDIVRVLARCNRDNDDVGCAAPAKATEILAGAVNVDTSFDSQDCRNERVPWERRAEVSTCDMFADSIEASNARHRHLAVPDGSTRL